MHYKNRYIFVCTHTHTNTIIINQTEKTWLYKETKSQGKKDEGRQNPTERNADKTETENTRKRSTPKWE
jgi:hypothetical protein